MVVISLPVVIRQFFDDAGGSLDDFASGGRVYGSLSAVAKAITGSHCNGYLFFRSALNHNKETA